MKWEKFGDEYRLVSKDGKILGRVEYEYFNRTYIARAGWAFIGEYVTLGFAKTALEKAV